MPEEEDFAEAAEVIGLVEGTVDDLKDYIREHDLEQEKLQRLLEAEKESKNRKTAVRFLENRLGIENTKDQEKAEESENIDREELLKILGGTVEEMKEYVRDKDPSDEQLQEILHAEKMVNDRKTAVNFLKSYSKKEDLKEDIKKAERDFRDLREDLNRIENEVLDEDIDLTGIELDKEEPEDKQDEEEEKPDQDEEEDEPEEEPEEKDNEEQEDDKDESPENNSEEELDEEGLSGEMQQKKEIAEELQADLSREELEDISLKELEEIRDEKAEREELIEDLKEEFDEEKLRNASTEDLRKLKKDLDSEGKSDKEKENEEIREEAEEDLEMLMGAVKAKKKTKETEESRFNLGDLSEMKSNLREKLSFRDDEEEEDEDELQKEDIINLLEQYRELDQYEASIKTAHIMKGYLEYSEGIDREMTYRELSEEIDPKTEEMEKLLKFFKKMNKDQYTGNITANVDEVIDSAETVIESRE